MVILKGNNSVKEIANLLISLRKQHGLSQSDLADRIQTSRQNISQYERGLRIPKFETLLKILHAIEDEPGTDPEDPERDILRGWLYSFLHPEENKRKSDFYDSFNLLNADGQNKVIDYTELLLSSGQYNRDPKQDPEE